MYYTGFQLGHKIRHYNFGGLAISKDGGDTFKRYSQAPIMDRADEGLFVRAGQSIELAGDKTFHIHLNVLILFPIKHFLSVIFILFNHSNSKLQLRSGNATQFKKKTIERKKATKRVWYYFSPSGDDVRSGLVTGPDYKNVFSTCWGTNQLIHLDLTTACSCCT